MDKKPLINAIASKYNHNATRLLDIFWDIQSQLHWVGPEAIEELSKALKISKAQIKDTLTFYHFFNDNPAGKHQIYLDDSIISEFQGHQEIKEAFEEALSCQLGELDPKGDIGFFRTSCIGMSDQSPAALIDGKPIGKLDPNKVKEIVDNLKAGKSIPYEVQNTVQKKGPILFESYSCGEAINKIKGYSNPFKVIEEILKSGIRGRGGAGFSTGKKWQFCYEQKEKTRYIVCNADEGEPGTFKDRFLLTEKAEVVFEGMISAAFALGAKEGLMYLRAEYLYLKDQLEETLNQLREKGFLGKNILGISNFDFDIRIQLGAGAYVVGEETALLESLEGKRGEPRMRPPFPVEEGYLGKPTIINNVETFASVVKILKHGGEWYRKFGTQSSPGTKLLSVSGDCKKPGIYEIEWGMTIGEFLEMVEAVDPLAVQVGGPSGQFVAATSKDRVLSFDDLATGGSMMVFSKERNILTIMKNFSQFFVDETCGCCTPCRAGNLLFKEQLDSISIGNGSQHDIRRIKDWAKMVHSSSRCGLGQSCARALTTSMDEFKDFYDDQVSETGPLLKYFPVEEKLKEYQETVEKHGRK